MVVVAFHTGMLSGGWVGVDLFFALSGWLITGLLIAEVAENGNLRIAAFWRRRARRLLPAVGVLLGFVALMAMFNAIDLRRRGVTGAITYSTNWLNIFGGVGYWDRFAAPDPLEHLWSLAVEEQIYVIWPLLMFAVVAAGGRRRAIRSAAVCVALCSTAVMLYGAAAGWSVDRLYQGTDTRSFAFAIGAASAGLTLRRLGNTANHLLAVSALAGIVWIGRNGANELSMFRGPMQAISLLGLCAVMAAAGVTGGPLCWLVPRRLGMWSYGIYLFHWPLAVAFEGRFSDPVWFALVAVLSTVAAAFSFWLVEQRIRIRGLPGWRLPVVGLAGAAMVAAAFSLTTPTTPAAADQLYRLPSLLPRPVVAPEQARRRVLVVGDSVPALAAEPIKAVGDRYGIDVGMLAEPGCVASPYPTDQYDKGVCGPFIAGLPKAIAAADPDEILWWFGGTGEGIYWNDSPTKSCSAEGTKAITGRVEWFLTLSGDIPSALVTPVPRTDLDATAAAGTACEVQTYLTASAATGEPVIRLDSFVCPDFANDCNTVDRSDGLHYTAAGAEVVAAFILDHLAPPLPPSTTTPGPTTATTITTTITTTTTSTTPPDINRVLVIGDSTAETVAGGLAAAGRLDVVDASRLGCPFAITTRIRSAPGEELATDYCPSEADRAGWLQQWQPDAILLVQGPSEEWDVRYEGKTWVTPGATAWAERNDDAIKALVAAAGETPIIIATAPGHLPPDAAAFESAARRQPWNDRIALWDRTYPTVAVLDLAKYMPSPGSTLDKQWRPDGVHMTKEIAADLARRHLVDDMLAAVATANTP